MAMTYIEETDSLLPEYPLPEQIEKLIEAGKYNNVENKVTKENYRRRMHNLLYLEEYQQRVDMSRCIVWFYVGVGLVGETVLDFLERVSHLYSFSEQYALYLHTVTLTPSHSHTLTPSHIYIFTPSRTHLQIRLVRHRDHLSCQLHHAHGLSVCSPWVLFREAHC